MYCLRTYILMIILKSIANQSIETDHDKRNSIENSIDGTIQISSGVIQNSANFLPTPKEVFEGALELIIGYPAEFMVNVFNEICTLALSADAIKPKYRVDYEGLEIQLVTACEIYHYKLADLEELRKNPNFNTNLTVFLFSLGWNRNPNDTENISGFRKAFSCRGDVNFLVLNAANYIDTLFVWAAYNTDDVGFYLSTFLMELKELEPGIKFHLVGHSLGAQIMGSAAHHYHQRSGEKIPRVTGLDPSNRCFSEGTKLNGIFRGDAEYLDIIHSNPGVLGKRDSMGDVDFYPNGLTSLAPGCFDVLCSHRRSYDYYIESIYPNNANNFLATRCTSMSDLRHGKCNGDKQPMGFHVPMGLKGNYFLEVNEKAPFGEYGNEEQEKQNEECGLCKK